MSRFGIIRRKWTACGLSAFQIFCGILLTASAHAPKAAEGISGILYTNERISRMPWSIHVARIDRTNRQFEIHSVHADGKAIGLSRLTTQVRQIKPDFGKPVAAINGDFYRRDSIYAGDPRGLQISEGELLSSPTGGPSFWIDAVGEPHLDEVASEFLILLPDGSSMPFGINGDRRRNRAELYTQAIGSSTFTSGRGREILLEADGAIPLTPLRIGRKYSARIVEIRTAGNTDIPAGKVVLSVPFPLDAKVGKLHAGDKIQLSTACSPELRGVRTAISGGPILIRRGGREKPSGEDEESYQSSSMFERHPRTAIGWNEKYFFFVEVDGRQRGLSVGMTLGELTRYMAGLGCENAMNMDGGGSATLWCLGRVRNSPCDGREREIANSLVVVAREHNVAQMKNNLEE